MEDIRRTAGRVTLTARCLRCPPFSRKTLEKIPLWRYGKRSDPQLTRKTKYPFKINH